MDILPVPFHSATWPSAEAALAVSSAASSEIFHFSSTALSDRLDLRATPSVCTFRAVLSNCQSGHFPRLLFAVALQFGISFLSSWSFTATTMFLTNRCHFWPDWANLNLSFIIIRGWNCDFTLIIHIARHRFLYSSCQPAIAPSSASTPWNFQIAAAGVRQVCPAHVAALCPYSTSMKLLFHPHYCWNMQPCQ